MAEEKIHFELQTKLYKKLGSITIEIERKEKGISDHYGFKELMPLQD